MTLGFISRTFNDQLQLDGEEEEDNSPASNPSEKFEQGYRQKK